MVGCRHFKTFFLRGLAALVPTVLTIWIFIWAYHFIQDNISVHINRGLVRVIALVADGYISVDDAEVRYVLRERPDLEGDPAKAEALARIRSLERFWVKGPGSIVGFVLSVVGVCMVGALLASVLGRTLLRMVEQAILNVPLLRRVYPYVKQVSDFFLTKPDQAQLFSGVVMVEYPRKGIWSLGFITGEGMPGLEGDLLRVMVPTSPTPITGYVIVVSRADTIAMDLTIEEAFRFVISAGVIGPGEQQFPVLAQGSGSLIRR